MRLTQKEFADLGGGSLSAQNKYESDKTEPSATYLARLLDAGIDILWLLSGRKHRVTDISESVSEWLALIDQLRPADQAALLTVARTMAAQTTPAPPARREGVGARQTEVDLPAQNRMEG